MNDLTRLQVLLGGYDFLLYRNLMKKKVVINT